MDHRPGLRWQPILDLPDDWRALADPHLPSLMSMWLDQARELRASSAYTRFLEQMRREIAIETGLIERLYTIDRGTTQLLIEHGIDESLIAHNATDRPVSEVVQLIRSQMTALDGIFDFVGGQRPLSNTFIRQLHQVLTEHQAYVDGVDQFGKSGRFPLIRGDWKKLPNNPLRADGIMHEYAPPEQTASEMDRLITMHQSHVSAGVPPEVEAAWLHHRFTQIHPFQDGNGRVARLLATLVFLRAQWFPLVVKNDQRVDYITALENADYGDLTGLIRLFSAAQRRAFKKSLSLSELVLNEGNTASAVMQAIAQTLQERTVRSRDSAARTTAHLIEVTRRTFEQTSHDLAGVLEQFPVIDVLVTAADNDDPARRLYNQFQVISAARRLDYFANVRAWHSWVALRLDDRVSGTHYEILTSVHLLGRVDRGIFAVSVLGYWKETEVESGGKVARDITPLIEEPFQFTATDNLPALEKQFQTWLDRALVVGLETWRRGL